MLNFCASYRLDYWEAISKNTYQEVFTRSVSFSRFTRTKWLNFLLSYWVIGWLDYSEVWWSHNLSSLYRDSLNISSTSFQFVEEREGISNNHFHIIFVIWLNCEIKRRFYIISQYQINDWIVVFKWYFFHLQTVIWTKDPEQDHEKQTKRM